MKILSLSLLLSFTSFAIAETYPAPRPPVSAEQPPPATPPPPAVNPNHPSVKGIKGMVGKMGKMGSQVFTPSSRSLSIKSGDWGLENLRLDTTYTFSSFDDASDDISSSGHYAETSFTLMGDLGEYDTLSLGFSKSKYETGRSQPMLARSLGLSVGWHHALSDNYGFGAFFLWSEVDIEEDNGNSHSYGLGTFVTSFHSFESFDLSTTMSIAHVDYDVGFDLLFLASVTASKQLIDKFGVYTTASFQDSLEGDPDQDPTHGSIEFGGIYSFNDTLALTVAYQKTLFMNNFSDNTLLVNLNWVF